MGNSPFIRVLHEIRLLRVPRSAAVRARDLHVWQELDIQADHACSVTSRAAEFSRIVGEIPGLIPKTVRVRCSRKDLSQLIMDIRIGRHRGADIRADGCRVDELHLTDPLRLDLMDVFRTFLAVNHGG